MNTAGQANPHNLTVAELERRIFILSLENAANSFQLAANAYKSGNDEQGAAHIADAFGFVTVKPPVKG